jgi:hypothetical protein
MGMLDGTASRARIQLGQNLFDGHTALVEWLTVEEYRRHRHYFARFDFLLV